MPSSNNTCIDAIKYVTDENGLSHEISDDFDLSTQFFIAECCRIHGNFSLAAAVLNKIEKSRFSASEEVGNAIARHLEKVVANDRTGLSDDFVAHQPKKKTVSITQPNMKLMQMLEIDSDEGQKLPSLIIRGWNFTSAMSRHAASGFERCSQDEIEARLAVCQVCDNFSNDHCQLCGCPCIAANRLLNKLALKSETCPLGKW